ncbi:MAG: GNAT family N-acetyltransferase [Beijerinckiaceae bacterium]
MDCAVMLSDLTIQAETRFDVVARERLLDAAFGMERYEKTSERLREERLPADGLAFALKTHGKLIGTIRLWNIRAGGVPALLLGPLAMAKSHEGMGLGSRLMHHALAEAIWRGHKAVILVGDAQYYSRFGFKAELTKSLVLPGPVERERFLGLELAAGALADACGLVTATGANIPLHRRDLRRQSTLKSRFQQQAA